MTDPRPSNNFLDKFSRKSLVIAWSAAGVFMLLCCGTCGVVMVIGNKMNQGIKTEFAEGDSLWDKGDKAGGAVKYRNIIDKDRAYALDAAERPRLYGRVIDFEFENGRKDTGLAYLDKAEKSGVTPILNHADAQAVIAKKAEEKRLAQVKIAEDKRLAEIKKLEKKREAEAKKKEEERLTKMTPEEKLKEAKPDDVVPSIALFREFDSNEVAAVDKYKGKSIMVEGEVDSVEKGGFGMSDKIILARQFGLQAVRCYVSGGSTDDLKKLQRGSWVRVRGRCDGKAPSGIVEMSGCIFVLINR